MKILAIILGKFTGFVGRMFHRGGSMPGKVALTIDKKLLKKFVYPKIKIAITGSSGKGSTSALLAGILKENGYKICFNDSGANLKYGFTSACLKSASLSGKIKADVMVIEIDEKYTKQVFEDYKPDYLIVTNITKDQPPRQHNIDITYEEIINTLPTSTKIVTMMDDPYLHKFALELKNEVIYYGLDKSKYSYKKQLFENISTYYCLKCGSLLDYDYYHFETLGKYHCPNCDFKWEEPYVLGTTLDLEKETIVIQDNLISIGGDMLFFAYNTLSAYTMAKVLGIEEDRIVDSINKINKIHSYSKNRNFISDKKIYKELKVKAEDAPTWNQSVLKIYQDKSMKDVMIGLHKISGRYTHEDISWLYDITFELINNDYLNKIYLLGGFTSDFETRLILARIPEDKIVICSSLEAAREKIKKDKVEVVYAMINYDYLDTFKSVYKEDLK